MAKGDFPQNRHYFGASVRGATYCPLAPAERWRRVAKDLRNWPTPYHRDDKTLAFLWREMD